MSTASGRWAALALAAPLLFSAQPSTAQVYGYPPGGAQDIYGDPGHDRRHGRSYQGQADQPGDYRCDAYWDRGRTDCDAGWRDQRGPWQRSAGRRHSGSYGGSAVYYGDYGRPDVVYEGGSYPGPDRYGDDRGQDHGRYGQGGRDPRQIAWCCAEYCSYDPATGYYIAYSGRPVFCG